MINCLCQNTVHPELWRSLQEQDQNFVLSVIENHQCPQRLSVFNQFQEEILVILDQDISLAHRDSLRRLRQVLQARPDKTLLCASYIDPKDLNYWGRCSNEQVRAWMKRGRSPLESGHRQVNVPGGLWAIKKPDLLSLQGLVPAERWGGEDQFEAQQLQKAGFQFLHDPNWDVYHHNSLSLHAFLRRAFRHGQARAQKAKTEAPQEIPTCRFLSSARDLFQATPRGPRSLGFLLHAVFVELGSLWERAKSFRARKKPQVPAQR